MDAATRPSILASYAHAFAEILGAAPAEDAETAGSRFVTWLAEALEELRGSGELCWPEPQTLTRGAFLRMLPGIHPCAGFFAAVLRKAPR